MKRDLSNNQRVERFFKEMPNITHRLSNIASATGLSRDQVRGAISYLNAKSKAGKAIEIRMVERGKSWRYVTDPEKPAVRKRSSDDPQDAVQVAGMGTAQFNRMVDALGDKPVKVTSQLPALTAELGAMHYPRTLELRVVGRTHEGFDIGMDDETNRAYKVVPL